MKSRRRSPAREAKRMRGDGHLDQRILAFVTLALVAFGLVMVYSATSASAAVGNSDPMSFLKRQTVYALLGLVCMTLAARFDYHRLRYLTAPLVLTALGLCTAVLVMGPQINGARRWFLLGPASGDGSSFELPDEAAKHVPALLEVRELVEARARGRQQDDVSRQGCRRGLCKSAREIAGVDVRHSRRVERGPDLGRRLPHEVRAVVGTEGGRERLVRLVLATTAENDVQARVRERDESTERGRHVRRL